MYNITTRNAFFFLHGKFEDSFSERRNETLPSERRWSTSYEEGVAGAYLVEQEAHPGQRPAAPAAGVDAAGAAEVEALEQLQQVVPRRRGRRHRQHPADRSRQA
jgi:hypothetical protein